MMKNLLFIPLLLIIATLPAIAQDDLAMQTAEGSLMAKSYTSAETNFTKYIKTFSDKMPAYLKKEAVYDTSSAFQKNFSFPDFKYEHKWAQAFCERGIARLGLGKKDSAGVDFETAIKIDHNYAEPYYQEGALMKEKGDKINSCIYMGRAIFLTDTLKRAKDIYTTNFCWMCGADYFKTGKMHVDLKEYKEGLTSLNMAVLICPDSASYIAYRGAAFDGLGKSDSALLDYSAALKLDSTNYLAYFHRAIAFEAKQRYQDAFTDLTKTISMNPTFADAYKHRAEDCENMEKEASAQYDYQQLIRLKPNDGEAYYKIALFKQKSGQDACDYFQKALDRGIDDAQGYVDDCKKAAAKENRMR
ncbi:MAG TPA: tetratricopeptide repeat protein [Bacteroidia bacterium]|jgi:tetratricopeptide (TPR) repeat protein|nr:tetratricopeptide repeat protein [Bacteroidia bacterium]